MKYLKQSLGHSSSSIFRTRQYLASRAVVVVVVVEVVVVVVVVV